MYLVASTRRFALGTRSEIILSHGNQFGLAVWICERVWDKKTVFTLTVTSTYEGALHERVAHHDSQSCTSDREAETAIEHVLIE